MAELTKTVAPQGAPYDFPPLPAPHITAPVLKDRVEPWLSCPDCGALLALELQCKRVRVLPRDANGGYTGKHDGGLPPIPAPPMPVVLPAPAFSREEQQVLTSARRAGLLAAFTQAVEVVKYDQVPKDMDDFFLKYLRGMVQRLIPQYALIAFSTLFTTRQIEYWSYQGIGCVIAEGAIRLFVPNASVVGERLRKLNASGAVTSKIRNLRIDDGEAKLTEWIRTRWGYVASDGAALDALRPRSFGAFANPSLSAPAPHRT